MNDSKPELTLRKAREVFLSALLSLTASSFRPQTLEGQAIGAGLQMGPGPRARAGAIGLD